MMISHEQQQHIDVRNYRRRTRHFRKIPYIVQNYRLCIRPVYFFSDLCKKLQPPWFSPARLQSRKKSFEPVYCVNKTRWSKQTPWIEKYETYFDVVLTLASDSPLTHIKT
jgi:hypothetical protein